MKRDFKNRYFNWIKNMTNARDIKYRGKLLNGGQSYSKLYKFLFSQQFIPIIEKDENRESDGYSLRRRFSLEKYNYDYSEDCDFPCSILEVIAALAIKIENSDGKYLSPEGYTKWFWIMLYNLGIYYMDDKDFDKDRANEIINIFNNRLYQADGEGSLFWVRKNTRQNDMRNIEIWVQWFLFSEELNRSKNI